jgi:MFS transporter, FSR family, fosmidomycin resistance protein
MSSESQALPLAVPSARFRSGLALIGLLSLAHFFIDLYSSALGVFQPVLVDKLHMNLAQAGILGGLLVFSSSVLQPLYGYGTDRKPSKLWSALAPGVAGVFIGSLGLAPTYGWAIALVLAGGIGIASFHPHASARASLAMETNRGRWMAVFISAGTLGLALGPILLSTLVAHAGFQNSYWAAVPGLLVSVLLLARLPDEGGGPARRRGLDWHALRAAGRPLFILYAAVFFRSTVQIVFTQFLTLYLSRERGYSLQASASILSLYLASGAVGGFAGGYLSDRIGGRRTILLSFLGSVPCLAVFFVMRGPWSIVGLALGGLILLFTIPVNVLMAQDLVPSQAGTVTALMQGFAWGTAGMIFIPLVGWVSDLSSLHLALSSLLVFPVLGFLITQRLPEAA